LAAYMAAECGISRLVRLVPPAHHHFTLSQSSNWPNALFSYPVTILLPPWLLHYLWRSHGWLPTWHQSAEFPDLYGLCLQRTTILHFPQAPTGLTHYSHAQEQVYCPLGFFITCGGLMVGCLHGSRVRNFQTCTACASSAPPFYTFPELQQA
jgi:hypothetical protein